MPSTDSAVESPVVSGEDATPPDRGGLTLLAYPFRPFFLLAGIAGVVLVPAWLGVLLAGWPPLASGMLPVRWHAHEMLFGLVPAAIAGFLLTAQCNWTGARPLTGIGLAALAAVWLGGRIAFAAGDGLPLWLVSTVDLAFLPLVAWVAARAIIPTGNRRNLVMVVLPLVLAAANAMTHLTLHGAAMHWAITGERLGLGLIVMMMVVIGGRITPAFTANWLARRGGNPPRVRHNPVVDGLAIGSVAALVPLLAILQADAAAAALAGVAALANAWRLAGWQGWRTGSDPLVWILHLGYAWVVAGLALMPAAWLLGLPDAVWLHALGTGAMGTLILGVMTRVALGHTGRPLVLPAGAVWIYGLITLAGLARVVGAAGATEFRTGALIAGLAWTGAFALFCLRYTPILLRPRPDGRPG